MNHKHPKKTVMARNATRGEQNGHTVNIDIGYLPISKEVMKAAKKVGGILKNHMVLVAVDSTSDYSWVLSIEDKSTKTIQKALDLLCHKIKSDGYSTSKLRCDGEKEVFADSTIAHLRTNFDVEVQLTRSESTVLVSYRTLVPYVNK